ncbi:MAG: NAD(P)-dependent glycerol-3-phosphate dehydrogenase [Halothiobacillaceae bacterium]|nr:MAG: NAD(P)-dependent glycerol-3-phosphate dehydrogenase [Halothiobacillaceae bacterium]
MSARATIAIFGAGAWGTALAILLARNGHAVRLWGRSPDTMARMQAERRNTRSLPDAAFPDTLTATSNLDQALQDADLALVVVPSSGFRAFLRNLAPHLKAGTRLAWASKGLEVDTAKRLDEIVDEELPRHAPPAVISGPTFAREVAAGLPTAVTVASADHAFAEQLMEWLHGPTFRAYRVDDVIGVELGGALKNVLAIAAGIADGLHFGANTRAAVITRGLAEIMRLGDALGARRETFMGLAGLGDLVLTCTDNQSRNRRFGLLLAEGKSKDEALATINQAVEGLPSAREAWRLAERHGVDMPITQAVHQVLYENLPAKAAVAGLLNRHLRPELD